MAGPFPCFRGWPIGIDINTFAFRKMNLCPQTQNLWSEVREAILNLGIRNLGE